MKSEYKLIKGLAYYEKIEMERLSKFAKEGLILKKVGKFFYKLEKGEPQDLVYAVDYRLDSDEEYFSLLKEAGWEKVPTYDKGVHILEAKKGTPEIYSDSNTMADKYKCIKNIMVKGIIETLLIGVLLGLLMYFSFERFPPVFFIATILLYFDFAEFSIKTNSYIFYGCRIKELKKYGECKETNKNGYSWKRDVMISSLLFIFGVLFLIEHYRHIGLYLLAFGVFGIFRSYINYKIA